MKNGKKRWGIALGVIVAIVALVAGFLLVRDQLEEKRQAEAAAEAEAIGITKDRFWAVYDKNYYLWHNPEVAQKVGTDDDAVFAYFRDYGMAEGQVASARFDPAYYRANNPDVAGIFGDELPKYYEHFVNEGYKEERQGAPESQVSYTAALSCTYLADGTVQVVISDLADSLSGQSGYLVEATANEEYLPYGRDPVWEGTLEQGLSISVPFHSVTNKFILAIPGQDLDTQIAPAAYLLNPEDLADTSVPLTTVHSKKGLQITDAMQDDIEELNLSYAFRNLFIEDIMAPNGEGDVQPYEYNGVTYYFRNDVLASLDEAISTQTRNGSIVTAGIINVYREGFEALSYPDAEKGEGVAFYAANTSTPEGLNQFEAFLSFVSDRYNGTDPDRGMIGCWTVSNEVNDSAVYNYMGPRTLDDYLTEYTRTFRVVYNVIKSNNPNANVYVPMEPWWGIDSTMLVYQGREFLDQFNRKMADGGNVDWGLAYHAYSYPLSDPKVLNDDRGTVDEEGKEIEASYFTLDNEDSRTITMENIDVLVDYMHRPEFLIRSGEVRSIILSEQGYTSNSNLYGPCEAQQAASMLYAYYKAETNPDIDAFIYFVQCDSSDASLGNNYYLFGLWWQNEDGTYRQKLSHDVLKLMDTKQSPALLAEFKTVLGIQNWQEVIPGFDPAMFDRFPDAEAEDVTSWENRLSLAEAEVTPIAAKPYTGQECLPDITVTYQGTPLTNDVDYDAVFLNNVETGTATVVVVGIGQYGGITTQTFQIQ